MQNTTLQFISRKPVFRGWRAAVLVTGALILIFAANRWVAQNSAVRVLEAKLSQEQPRNAVQRSKPSSEQRMLDMHAKAVADAVRQLNLPVGEIVDALQPPRDIRVALLGIDLSGKGTDGLRSRSGPAGNLKIAAEARTPQDMTTYLAFVGAQPHFQSVYLLKHELNGNAPEKPYRFQLEAQWRE